MAATRAVAASLSGLLVRAAMRSAAARLGQIVERRNGQREGGGHARADRRERRDSSLRARPRMGGQRRVKMKRRRSAPKLPVGQINKSSKKKRSRLRAQMAAHPLLQNRRCGTLDEALPHGRFCYNSSRMIEKPGVVSSHQLERQPQQDPTGGQRGVNATATPARNQKFGLSAVSRQGDRTHRHPAPEAAHPPPSQHHGHGRHQPAAVPVVETLPSGCVDLIDSHCQHRVSQLRKPDLADGLHAGGKLRCGGAAPLPAWSLAKFRRSVPGDRFRKLRYSVGVHPLDPQHLSAGTPACCGRRPWPIPGSLAIGELGLDLFQGLRTLTSNWPCSPPA